MTHAGASGSCQLLPIVDMDAAGLQQWQRATLLATEGLLKLSRVQSMAGIYR